MQSLKNIFDYDLIMMPRTPYNIPPGEVINCAEFDIFLPSSFGGVSTNTHTHTHTHTHTPPRRDEISLLNEDITHSLGVRYFCVSVNLRLKTNTRTTFHSLLVIPSNETMRC